MPTSEVTWSLSRASTHPTMVMVRVSFHIHRPSHSWNKAISNLTLKIQGQGHGYGQRARLHSQPSIQQTCFHFLSHQSDQQFLRNNYFKIWPWKIQAQGHGWGQRSRSHSWPSIQLMHFLFVSHQSDQKFLRYGQWIVWPWKRQNFAFRNSDMVPTSKYILKKLMTFKLYPIDDIIFAENLVTHGAR